MRGPDPAAAETGDEERALDRRRRDRGLAPAPGDEAETVLEPVHEIAARQQPTERVKLRLALEGADEETERLQKIGVTEVVEAAALARFGEKRVGIERDPGRIRDAVKRFDPGRTRSRAPVGGGALFHALPTIRGQRGACRPFRRPFRRGARQAIMRPLARRPS
jgi:hypothetical protein